MARKISNLRTVSWEAYGNQKKEVYYNLDELLISVDHGNWRVKSDGGGPFLKVSTHVDVSPAYINLNWIKGQVLPVIPFSLPNRNMPVKRTDAQMGALGTTAISRVLPTNPSASLSVALGETIKDGLPQYIGSSVFKEQVRTAHKAGHEFLNFEFGWLPLVSDLKKLAHAVKHRDRIMESYIRYSDKQIRRDYNFAPEGESKTVTTAGYLDAYSTLPMSCHVTDDYQISKWFNGSFRYHIPVGVSFADKAAYHSAQASKILGLELTPEVVWNLAPWSWAVDWFTNTGDVIHNISRLGKDGLAMRYGYMMYNHYSARTISGRGVPDKPTAGCSSYYKIENEIKQRLPATPYGFGLTYNGLSNTQKGVIAALGLTRAF